ncbi:helix-turn-helix domain-containing protein [Micromonospora sp. D93]|uniref:helix-turn-helix domain-containing protein n=1 Tax=Micromonospora sp. D93 TaxID=2824886 RepID=UPI0027DBB785|nr:helix-turn-helix domain-containing protein [Micromonospora sp. D93]
MPAIARLAQADEDTIRQVIHRFNEMGMACLDPQRAGGRPRQISPDEEQSIVETANTRPEKLGRPFTRWSVRKLADHLSTDAARRIRIGRERLQQILHQHKITFQRTKTWEESTDPDRDAKLARIEYVSSSFPQRVFAFDEFGPLLIRPVTHPADPAEQRCPGLSIRWAQALGATRTTLAPPMTPPSSRTAKIRL